MTPTGRDIPEGISANIEMLNDRCGLDEFKKKVAIKWCAITWEQVEEHDIPSSH